MHIRCPHCHNPIEVIGDDLASDIVCTSCGSSFSLISGDTTRTHASSGSGRKIAHFELVEQLGIGHFGAVWKARDTELDRIVAVKLPRKDQLEPGEAELFLREARAAAQLRHPGIVSVHEVGRDGDSVYIVSDYIAGANLKEWLTAQRLTPRESAQLVAKIAEGLEHAHQAGVIHRDLKPGNILMDFDSQPHIADFGLAKREAGEITMTVEGRILGTPAYMPPEQARGEGHQADRRSDIYSLGVILFELLTGELPFRGDQRMLVVQILRDEPDSPRKLNSRVPRDLETITLKCLQKDPMRRYQSAAELAADLKRYLAGEAIQARPVGRIERGWRWVNRNRSLATAIAAVMVLHTTVAAVSTLSAFRIDSERQRADQKADEALKERTRADAKATDALAAAKEATRQKEHLRQAVYISNMNLAQRSWEVGNVAHVNELLDQVLPRDGERDLRGWEWYYQRQLCQGDLRTLEGHSWGIRSLSFSPDGRRLASASGDHTVKLWDVESGSLLRSLAVNDVTSVAFGPDGRKLASASDDTTIKLWDTESGAELRALKGHTSVVRSVAFSPDGRRLASVSGDQTTRLWDTETGAEIRTLLGHTKIVLSVAFSPDGRRLATAGDDHTVKLWDAESGTELQTLAGHPGVVYCVVFSPDGRKLASASDDTTIKLWDAESGAELRALKGHFGIVRSVAFSPDGRRLASASGDKTIKLWDPESGLILRTLQAHTYDVTTVAFSPDSRLLASSSEDRTIKLWDAQFGADVRTLAGHADDVNGVAFCPDGRRLVSASNDQSIKLWDAEFGTELRTLNVDTGAVLNIAVSPDGRRLASASTTIKLWDAESGVQLHTLQGHMNYVTNVAFSPNGGRLASASFDETIKLWNASSGEVLRTLKGHAGVVRSVAFSPDGQRLATASDDYTFKLWDAESGVQLRTFKGHTRSVMSVAFSGDGRRLASGSDDRTIMLWNTESGAQLRALHGHFRAVRSISFAPDGQRLASASEDQTVKIWDTESGAELRTLKGHTGKVLSVAFSPDGRRVASASDDQTIMLWDTDLPSADEKMARFLVDRLYEERPDPEDLAEAVQERKNWTEGMRTAALKYIDRTPWDAIEQQRAMTRLLREVERADWPQAVDSLTRLAKATDDSETSALLASVAIAKLGSGDAAGYREACVLLWNRSRSTELDDSLTSVAAICTAGPKALDDLPSLVAAVEPRHVVGRRNSTQRGTVEYYLLVPALAALYRAGEYESVIQAQATAEMISAVASRQASPAYQELRTRHALFQSMAYQQLGQTEQAARWLKIGQTEHEKILAEPMQQPREPQFADVLDPSTWQCRLMLSVLRKEAEALISPERSEAPAGDSP